jgi:hypothetical protein
MHAIFRSIEHERSLSMDAGEEAQGWAGPTLRTLLRPVKLHYDARQHLALLAHEQLDGVRAVLLEDSG